MELNSGCLLCGADQRALLYPAATGPGDSVAPSAHHSGHGPFVRCRGCGLVYAHPRPDPARLADGYRAYADEAYLAEEAGRAGAARKVLRAIRPVKPAGRALELGCACGILLHEFQQAGYATLGLELSEWAGRVGRERYGLDIRPQTLEAAGLGDREFDVVILNDTLEHLADPVRTLGECRRVLKDDGVLYIFTPDVGSVAARRLGGRWWNVVAAHTALFDAATLERLLGRCGFRGRRLPGHGRTFSLGYWLELGRGLAPGLAGAAGALAAALGLRRLPVTINFHDQLELIAVKGDRDPRGDRC